MPKYQDLSTIFEANLESSPGDREKQGWIMSISKSICGMTTALMAADGDFGEKEIDATLSEILQHSYDKYPDRRDKISQYLLMLQKKGYENIKISQLASHRAGLVAKSDYFTTNPRYNLDVLGFFNGDEIDFNAENVGTTWYYSNPGFMLLEEILNIASQTGSYYLELQERVLRPLGLQNTKSIYDSTEAMKCASNIVRIKDVQYFGFMTKQDLIYSPLHFKQTGTVSLTEGGLSSTINDLEIISEQLTNLILGLPNRLVGDLEKLKKINGYYTGIYEKSENCIILKPSHPDKTYAANHYSLGVYLEAIDENGERVQSRQKPQAKLRIRHGGEFTGNKANMKIDTNVSIEDFRLHQCSQELRVDTDLFIRQQDILVKHSLLPYVGHKMLDQLVEYLTSKSEEGNKFTTKDQIEWRHIAIVDGLLPCTEWIQDLIKKDKLPDNFLEIYKQINEFYMPAQEMLRNNLIRDFFDLETGVIDSDKLMNNVKSAREFNYFVSSLQETLDQAASQTSEILRQVDLNLESKRDNPQSRIKLHEVRSGSKTAESISSHNNSNYKG